MFINEKKLAHSFVDRLFEKGHEFNVLGRIAKRLDDLLSKFNDSESQELMCVIIRNLAEGFGKGLAEGAIEGYKKK